MTAFFDFGSSRGEAKAPPNLKSPDIKPQTHERLDFVLELLQDIRDHATLTDIDARLATAQTFLDKQYTPYQRDLLDKFRGECHKEITTGVESQKTILNKILVFLTRWDTDTTDETAKKIAGAPTTLTRPNKF
jgi:hypothetical protein